MLRISKKNRIVLTDLKGDDWLGGSSISPTPLGRSEMVSPQSKSTSPLQLYKEWRKGQINDTEMDIVIG